MYKIIGLCVILKKKLDEGTMRFTGENLGKAKGLRHLIIFVSFTFFFILWGSNGYKEWIIQLD
jgi:hypothetical protein